MKLKDLKSCIDQAYKKTDNGNVNVEVYIIDDKEEKIFEIKEVGQFRFVPDVTIGISLTGEDTVDSEEVISEDKTQLPKDAEKWKTTCCKKCNSHNGYVCENYRGDANYVCLNCQYNWWVDGPDY